MSFAGTGCLLMLGLILAAVLCVYLDYRRNQALRIKYSDLHRYRISPQFHLGKQTK